MRWDRMLQKRWHYYYSDTTVDDHWKPRLRRHCASARAERWKMYVCCNRNY